MVVIKFFAYLREQVGTSQIDFDLQHPQTVAQLRLCLIQQDPKWQVLLEQDVLVAVNQNLCGVDTQLNDGDELAFFPPVTGG